MSELLADIAAFMGILLFGSLIIGSFLKDKGNP